MAILHTGGRGKPLGEIIKELGNKEYEYIECRCKWVNGGEKMDDFFGACSYKGGELTPLDGDTYSLGDLYEEWEEVQYGGKETLVVWEYGELISLM